MKIKILPLLIASVLASCTKTAPSSSSSINESSDISSSEVSSSSETISSEQSNSSSTAISSSIAASSSSEISSSNTISSSTSSSSTVPVPIKEADFTFKTAAYYEPEAEGNSFKRAKKATFSYAIKDSNEFIPYTTLDLALSYIFTDYTRVREGNIITYTCPDDLVFMVDKVNDTITAKNYDEMNIFSKKYDTKLGLIDEATTTKYTKGNNHTYEGGEDVVFNLKNYNLGIYEYDDEFYMPFAVVNNLTFNLAFWSSINFNGSAFYLLNFINGAVGLYSDGSDYEKSFHNGMYAVKKARNDNVFREYNYNTLMFQVDHSYGFLDKKHVPFDTYLKANNPNIINELKSTSEQTYCRAVEYLMEVIIGDGHTNVGDCSSACSSSPTYNQTYVESERVSKLYADNYDCAIRRRNVFNGNPSSVRFIGNTAIITFDSFKHASIEFTTSNITSYKDNDTFALVYDAFEKIKAKSDIKNVVIDLTVNGGGDTNAAIPILGFMQKNVDITMYSPLTKITGHLSYNIDTNLDGVYNDDDNYADEYKFYVLTSNYSFSCANFFPHVCKENGAAKIIGERSGGGACPVYFTATPDGKTYRISAGTMRFGCKDDPVKDNDEGVSVDIPISRDNFYNDTYLNQLLNNQ